MQEVFGIPVDTLLVILAVALAVALGLVGVLALRNRILLKLAVRNVGRRRGRSALIVVGPDARDDHHRRRADDGRHDEPHDPRDRGRRARRDRRDDRAERRRRRHPGRPRIGHGDRLGRRIRGRARRVSARGNRARDGVTGAIVDQVALQAPVQRQNEPSVVLFAADPEPDGGLLADRRLGAATSSRSAPSARARCT